MKTPIKPLLNILIFVVALPNWISMAARADDIDSFDRDSLRINDRIILKSGESINGKLISAEEKKPVKFRTADGIELELDRKLISKVDKSDAVAKRYNEFLSTLEDTAKSHRELVEWCKEQDNGRLRFKNQILFHNKRVVKLDPNDRKARRELGYSYLKDENRWVDEDQFWTGQGYVRQGAAWVPQLQDRVEQQKGQDNDQYSARKQKFNLWKRKLRRMSAAEAISTLLAIADRSIMPDIYSEYEDEKNPAIKSVFIEVFASARPVHSLQVKGLVDAVVIGNSDKALDYLMQDDFNQRLAAEYLTTFLTDKLNNRVQRAAFALGEMDSQYSILALANALVTKHKVAPGSNGRMSTTFGNAGGGSQQFGGNKKPTYATVENNEVRVALKKITQQDFGFSKQAYQRWYINHYTVVGMKARR